MRLAMLLIGMLLGGPAFLLIGLAAGWIKTEYRFRRPPSGWDCSLCGEVWSAPREMRLHDCTRATPGQTKDGR